jgi:hypothetical protein
MGFPSFVVLDEDGEMLAKVEARSVEGFEKALAAAQELRTLDLAGRGGDAGAAKSVLLKRIGWQAMPLATATEQLAKFELSEEERSTATRSLLGIELAEARLCEDKSEGLKRLLRILDEGRLVDDATVSGTFWRYLAVGAEQQKDAAAFARYVEYLKAQVAKNPRMQGQLDAAEKKLAALKQ